MTENGSAKSISPTAAEVAAYILRHPSESIYAYAIAQHIDHTSEQTVRIGLESLADAGVIGPSGYIRSREGPARKVYEVVDIDRLLAIAQTEAVRRVISVSRLADFIPFELQQQLEQSLKICIETCP